MARTKPGPKREMALINQRRKDEAAQAAAAASAKPSVGSAIFEAEAKFLASRERRQLASGAPIPNRSTSSDWFIRGVEGGPPPMQTANDFERAQDAWEKKIDNQALIQQQLYRNFVIDVNNEPLGRNKKPIPNHGPTYQRMQKLIANYQYESEPDDDELENIKHIPNHKPRPNAFSEFLVQRKRLLLRLGGDDLDTRELQSDRDSSASPEQNQRPRKYARKQSNSDDDEDHAEQSKSTKKHHTSKSPKFVSKPAGVAEAQHLKTSTGTPMFHLSPTPHTDKRSTPLPQTISVLTPKT